MRDPSASDRRATDTAYKENINVNTSNISMFIIITDIGVSV